MHQESESVVTRRDHRRVWKFRQAQKRMNVKDERVTMRSDVEATRAAVMVTEMVRRLRRREPDFDATDPKWQGKVLEIANG